MPILKMLGTMLILLAGCLAARTLVLFEKKKVSILENWIDLIDYIRMQIDCYLMPLDRILASCSKALVPMRLKDGPINLEELLEASKFYLDAEGERLIRSFVREIGTSYREEQLRRCDFFLTSLQRLRDQKKAELPARIRLFVSLCLCSSLALAILFW